MKLIPNTPYDNKSKAELKVFDALSECFCDDDFCFAFHSVNITNNPYKLTSEADFVVLCEYGLFVLEVKGGRIISQNGKWFTINKNNEELQIQNPFKQAKDAFYFIRKKIKEQINVDISGGFGVVFSDCEFFYRGFEWEEQLICDENKIKNFEKYLKNLFIYWQNKNIRLNHDEILKIKEFLRPDIISYSPFKKTLYFTNSRISNNLALKLAKKHNNSALICKSNFLQNYLKNQNILGFTSSLEDLSVNKKRANINIFDSIVICQGELFNKKDLKELELSFNGGFKEGKWFFFCESQNNESVEYLRSFLPKEIYLRKKKLKIEHLNSSLSDSIKYLLDLGFKKSEITILSEQKPQIKENLYLLDNFNVRFFPPKNISFSKSKDFIGLENKAIIAVNMDDENYKIAQKSAKCILVNSRI